MSLFGQSEHNSGVSNDLILAFLSSRLNLNPARLEQILQVYPSLEIAIEDNFGILKNKKAKWLDKWSSVNLQTETAKIAEKLAGHQIKIVNCQSDNYPATLRSLPDFPVILYYQGNLDLVQNSQMLTVVGSRNFGKYAELLLTQILSPVCQLGVGVVSGLAFGTDAAAHQIALSKGAPTIAVIGSGLDDKSFYPKANLALKTQILHSQNHDQIGQGLVLSEYGPGVNANVFTFPQRNRLLAALTDLTWVVEASLKSGSLITALKANDLGKTVATTPGSVFEENLAGNLKLLKNGASLIASSEDILTLLGLKQFPQILPQQTLQFGSPEEQRVWQNLTLEPQETLLLSQKVQMSISQLSTHLTMLEISGLAINLGENNWIRGG